MISFCCPSRGRPELAKRLVDTATKMQDGDTEFLFYLNDDDPKFAVPLNSPTVFDEPSENGFISCPITVEVESNCVIQIVFPFSSIFEKNESTPPLLVNVVPPKLTELPKYPPKKISAIY